MYRGFSHWKLWRPYRGSALAVLALVVVGTALVLATRSGRVPGSQGRTGHAYDTAESGRPVPAQASSSEDLNPAIAYGVSDFPVEMTPEELGEIWEKRRALHKEYLDARYDRKPREKALALGLPKKRANEKFEIEGTFFPKLSFKQEAEEQYEQP